MRVSSLLFVGTAVSLVVLVLCAGIRFDELQSYFLYIATQRQLIVVGILLGITSAVIIFRKQVWYFFPTAIACLAICCNDVKMQLDDALLPEYGYNKLVSNHDLHGTVSIITGGNSGLGYALAISLVGAGSTVILGCRDTAKCAGASSNINSLGMVDAGVAIPMQLDLASFKSIDSFADDFLARFSRLDYLVNNAGFATYPAGSSLTEDGLELGLGTMHFGHFLLTKRLLPLLKQTSEHKWDVPARVVMISSAAGQVSSMAKFHDSLHQGNGEGDLRGEITTKSQYFRSKLANVLFAKELAKQNDDLIVCSLHPGVVLTNIWSSFDTNIKVIDDAVMAFKEAFMRSAPSGIRIILRCLLDPQINTNAYLNGMGLQVGNETSTFLSADSRDDALAARLWEVSERIVSEYRNQ